jgi:GR25 family glycosyltransferase involved in LPS biosynthesis
MHLINEWFDKVFIITLKGSERSKKLKDRFDFDYELFYGIDGRYIDRKNSRWSNGQLGCTMSHINLYKHIIDNKIQKTLILEDDALPCNNLNNIDNYMKQLPNDWGMLYLFYTTVSLIPNYNKNWFKLNINSFQNVMCTSSIALQLDFAKDIYEINKNYLYTADGAYSALVTQKQRECYLACPKLFEVDYQAPSITCEVDKCLQGKEYII